MAGIKINPTYPPGHRRLGMWFVTQRGDALWTGVTGSPRQIDRSLIESTARLHGLGGAYKTQPNMRMVTPR